MQARDTILTINSVEPDLVRAVKLHSKKMGKHLKGLVLIHKEYAPSSARQKDSTGLFKEIICDFDNKDELQTVLKPYANKLIAATCRFEHSIDAFRQVIPFLPYVHKTSETSLIWSTKKTLMRDRLRNYDPALVPQYRYIQRDALHSLKKLINDFEFPVIVKPDSLAKSLLVSHCNSEAELKTCLNRTFKVIDQVYAREHRYDKPLVLIEEMMQGEMYSTDAYITHEGEIFCLPLVRVITAQSIGLPGFYGYRCIIPTGLSKLEAEAAFEASRKAVRALNLSSTTAHIELFKTKQGWKIIEVGARIGGYRQDLYRQAYGIEHFYNDLAVRMGMKPEIPANPIKHASALNIYAEEEGIIASIEGIDEARKLSSVVYLKTHAKSGDLALFASNGGDLIVDAILSNVDPKKLERDVIKVTQLVKIKLRQAKFTKIAAPLPQAVLG